LEAEPFGVINIAVARRLVGFWVSENAKENVPPAPEPLLGETESAEGWGAGRETENVPLEIQPVLVEASEAARYTALLPVKLERKVT
jgi:hypothetical protein